MKTMTPGPFLGSMPSPDAGGARLSRELDLMCSGLAVLAAAAVWLGALLNGPINDVAGLPKASCLVLLAASLLGIVLLKTVSGWDRLGAAIILEAVGRRLGAHPSGRAVRLALEETPARGIAGLVEALVWRVRRLNTSQSCGAERSDLYEAAVREGRAQMQQIVCMLYQNADSLSEAYGEIVTLAQCVDADGREVSTACAATESAFGRTEKHLFALTGAVAATTGELRLVIQTSANLSNRAFAGQRDVAALDDGSAMMLIGIEQIECLVKQVGELCQSATAAAARSGEAGATLIPIAASMQDLARGMLAAVASLQANAAGMSGHVAAAARTAQEICEWVTAQHDLSQALSHAVRKQGEDIGDILRSLEETRSGFVTLRASVDAVTNHSTATLAATGLLRETAANLPSHADAVAAIFRDIPECVPSLPRDNQGETARQSG